MENILTENSQLEKDNALLKSEVDNIKIDLSEPKKMDGDSEVSP